MAVVLSNLTTFPVSGPGPSTTTRGNVTLTIQPSTSMGMGMRKQPHVMRYQHNSSAYQMGMADVMADGPGRRLRKNVANVRRHVDYVSTVLNHAENRLWQYGRKQRMLQQPDELYQNSTLPVHCTPDVPVDCVLTKFVRAAMNKVKCPVYSVCWSPEGKRLITGASTGEFTLWNGTAFNFETILQAHDSAIRALKWSANEQWLLSADQEGYVKYWQPNMNNVHMFSAHKDEAIRGIAFSPTDVKFATASDDGTARVWDFARCSEERVLRGHGSEVRCLDWHPTKGLVVTGSRDTQQPVKLWDPKSGQCLATFQEHKSSVMAVEFNRNGNWLLTGGRDHLVKMYDIRVMKEVHTYRAHKKEVISVAWHPIHEGLFVSGGGDGSIAYWLVDNEKEIGLLEHAHDQAIWAMKWHPMGHILATGSNDNNTKFWARNRPGDTQEDIFGLSAFTNMVGALDKEREPKAPSTVRLSVDDANLYATDTFIPGMGLDEELYEQINRDSHISVGSLDTTLLVPDDVNRVASGPMIGAKRTLIKQPPAKKAQRQFERMWNNSKGIGAGTDDFSAMIGGMGREDESAASGSTNNGSSADAPVRKPKAGLLGSAPTPSLLGAPKASPSLLGPSPSMLGRPAPPASSAAPPRSPSAAGTDAKTYPNGPQPSSANTSWVNRGPPGGSRGEGSYQDGSNPTTRQPLRPTPTAGGGPPNADKSGSMMFSKPGVPIPPAGLPPHLWPMPPSLPGTSNLPPQTNNQPHPQQRPNTGADIDYRQQPPKSAAGSGGDVDLRSVSQQRPPVVQPMHNMPPPNMNSRPPMRKEDEVWRTLPSPSSDPRLASMDPRIAQQQAAVDPRLGHQKIPTDPRAAHQQNPMDARGSHQQNPSDPRGTHQQSSKDSRAGHQQNPMDPRAAHHQNPLDPRGSHQQSHMDPRGAHHQSSMDPRMAHQQSSMDPRMAHQQNPLDPRVSHQQSSMDPRTAQQQGHTDPRMANQQSSMDPRLAHQQSPLDPRVAHQQSSMDPRTAQQQGHMDPRLAHQQSPLDPRVAHQQSLLDPRMVHQHNPMDPRMAQQQKLLDPRVAHQHNPMDPRIAHQQTALDPRLGHQNIPPTDPRVPHQQNPIDPRLAPREEPAQQAEPVSWMPQFDNNSNGNGGGAVRNNGNWRGGRRGGRGPY